MQFDSKFFYSFGGLLLLTVLFLALTMITGSLFRGARLDLTENNLYTLSDGTKNILSSIEEPLQMQLYFSDAASSDLPQLRSYYRRVRELLEEFKQRSGGKLQISYIDPAPFSEEEDRAAAFGLQAVPINTSGDTLYFGLVATNAIDGAEVMPFLQPDKEEFLEYDLAKIVYTLNQPDRLKVGIITGLPINGGFDPQQQSMTQPWAIYDQLEQLFELEQIEATATELPVGIAMLVMVHPKDLSSDLKYSIDQFALNGGRVLAFVDAHSEQDGQANPQAPGAPPQGGGKSDLPDLFAAWGIVFDELTFVGDAQYALQVSVGAGQPPVRHLGILGLNNESINGDDIVTADLSSVNMSTAGHFTPVENATTVIEPLLQSSENSQLLDTQQLQFLASPDQLLNGFQASGIRYNLALRVSGEASTAYPDRVAGNNGVSSGSINAVLIGDTDMLTDPYWVQSQNFFGQTIRTPFANNGDLAINAVDNLIGNSDLISIRTRAVSSRPFDRVNALRLDAERRLRDTEQQLQQRLQETEQRLNELQSTRGNDAQDTNLAVFTPEQEAEIQGFLDQKLEIRRELRQVRRELDKDIESLGNSLKAINIGLVPFLVLITAVLLNWRRRRTA